jgi:signal transduction histidine kinase
MDAKRTLKAKTLRQKAEGLFGKGKTPPVKGFFFDEKLKLVHELELFQIELELQIEELERLNAEKDKLFSILAHDLKSPFNAFLGLTEILEEQIHILDKESLRSIATSLRKSAANVYYLIENLFAWARMQRGLIEHNPETACLLTVIERNTALLSDIAIRKEQQFRTGVSETLYVHADIPMLDLTLRNLLTNAMKFSSRGSTVQISARTTKGHFIETAIKDQGIGINVQLIERLFHIDETIGRRGTEGEESSGLGLLLCKEFVEKNGGEIWVESLEGKGSTFSFTIPASKEVY